MTAATTSPLLETKAAFARRLGVNKSTVTRAGQEGRLVLVAGKVAVEQSLARWQATAGGRTDLAEKHAKNRAQRVQNAKQVSHLPKPKKTPPRPCTRV